MRFTRGPIVARATILVIAAGLPAFAQLPAAGPDQHLSAPADIAAVTDIEYCTGGGKPLLMDLYRPRTNRPADNPGLAPAVLWIHGGGWRNGSKAQNSVAILLAQNGFVAATLNYRLSGEAPFPAAIEDSKCAVRFLRSHAAQYGIDADRIGVGGGSAGGHLAMLVGYADKNAGLEGSGGWPDASSAVRAVVSYFGPADFSVGHTAFENGKGPAPLKFLGGTLEEKPDVYRRASPVTYVTPNAPPLLMIHGDRDRTVPFDQSERMLAACKRAGVQAELVKVEGADHGFRPASDKPNSVSSEQIRALTVDFFKRYLTFGNGTK